RWQARQDHFDTGTGRKAHRRRRNEYTTIKFCLHASHKRHTMTKWLLSPSSSYLVALCRQGERSGEFSGEEKGRGLMGIPQTKKRRSLLYLLLLITCPHTLAGEPA